MGDKIIVKFLELEKLVSLSGGRDAFLSWTKECLEIHTILLNMNHKL